MSKRRYKKKAISIRVGELATKERRRQHGGVRTEIVDRSVDNKAIVKRHRAIAECTLDRYFLRELISEAEYEAGMKFRHAYLRAVLRIKVDDVGVGAHGDLEMSALMVIKSEKLLREAYGVLSLAQQTVIIAVCGFDEWAGGAYRLETFHRGLEKLIDLWKLADKSPKVL